MEHDPWAEIHNYDYNQWVAEEEKKKMDYIKKKMMVRDTLAIQLKEQEDHKMKIMAYNKRMDNVMLHNDKKMVEQEKKEKFEMKKRVELQKAQRDVMLLEAKEKRIREVQEMRMNEIKEVQKLKSDLEKEKRDKINKKKREREEA